ncbi:MAG TPA: hypothetical protein VJL82_06130 [Rhizomicrobium sp.]|nr:hypothetical protein [Rhizomicrobium sp.]
MIRFWSLLFAIVCLTACGKDSAANSGEPSLPTFLPKYYLPALKISDSWPNSVARQNQSGVDQYSYETADQAVGIIIGQMPCAASACEAVFNNFMGSTNRQATANSGNFVVVNPTEYWVEWESGAVKNSLFVFRLSNSLLIWNYRAAQDNQAFSASKYFNRLRDFANRQRYEQALADGNVEMGHWGKTSREYAEALLKSGQKKEALTVLSHVVATSPTDYLAQLALAANSEDSSVARNSAQVVFDNAEDPELISKSANLLRQADPASVQLPLLEKADGGLQVVLIPLAPCDIGLLEPVAAMYSGITKIPVKIVRLREAWQLGPPDRFPNQRQIQQFITERRGSNPDFTGWTLERYKSELTQIFAASDALTKFSLKPLIGRLNGSEGQYSVDILLERFANILNKYRSKNARTLFVGITKTNISAGDANFLFSMTAGRADGQLSILSYHMMLSKTLGAPDESRSRLVERIAKELVPATLNQLGIPRPVDPKDPFSYSSGVDRLDQKTLTLSKPTEEALAKFR